MSLKVELKPGERIIIGDCVVTNSDQRTRLYIDGQAPILREKDILTPEQANSPAKRVYFAVQSLYLDGDSEERRQTYFSLVNDIVEAAPSTTALVDEINNEILTGSLYKALRVAKKLITHEQGILANARTGGSGIPDGGEGNSEPS